jgi:hypothetical protein
MKNGGGKYGGVLRNLLNIGVSPTAAIFLMQSFLYSGACCFTK